MQLVAYGAQDIYLTGNPQITFFKVVFRRHTNFSMESIRQTPNGSGENQTITISRNGDLVHKIYIEWTLNSKKIWAGDTYDADVVQRHNEMLGAANLIKRIECEIGGQLIDRQSGLFLQMYGDLTELNPTGSELSKYNNNILKGGMGNMRPERISFMDKMGQHTTFWTPLKFWFCRNPGLALPLIALQYHEVKINVELNTEAYLSNVEEITQDYWVDYIYLDTDERRRFAQVSHEYLIEQVQEQSQSVEFKDSVPTCGKVDLVFNHPVKELIWTWQNDYALTTMSKAHTLTKMIGGVTESAEIGGFDLKKTTYQVKLNGHDRFAEMTATYFTRTQVWKYHTGSSLNRTEIWSETNNHLGARGATMINNDWNTDYINVYSFALKPEEHQPSGTCNFSRIDSATLDMEQESLDSGHTELPAINEINIYALNYNVLRIMSGMGGLAYSN